MTETDIPESDCINCGERIVLVPIMPDPLRGDHAWFHLATGLDVCAPAPGDATTQDPDAPTLMATPPETAE
jgi:hypothetical protein